MASPTERTLKYLREKGYYIARTEHWNSFARIRQDLFGFVDVLAITPDGQTIGVQCTSESNVSSRVNKIAEHEGTPWLRKAGWSLWVMGWKKGRRGEPRIVDCS